MRYEASSNGHHQNLHTSFLDFHFTETSKNVVLYTLPTSQEGDGGGRVEGD